MLLHKLIFQEIMFGWFKKKTELARLQDSYKSLMEKAHKTSQINRTASDKIMEEADQISMKIADILKTTENQ
jgi:hypothetical protein